MFVRNETFTDYIKLYPIITGIAVLHTLLYGMAVLPYIPHNWIYESLTGANIHIDQGEYWRLATPIFVHVSFSHFIFNTIALLIFGPPLEKHLGPLGFSCFYLLCGITGNLATFLIQPLTYVHTGSSGALFGLFGYYIALAIGGKRRNGQLAQVILPIVIISLFMTFIQPGINLTAHLFGLAAGIMIGLLFYRQHGDFQ